MSELTTTAPPVSVTRQQVTDALALLGLGFDGVSSVRIFLASDTIVVQWVEPKGRRRVSGVKVRTGLQVVRCDPPCMDHPLCPCAGGAR